MAIARRDLLGISAAVAVSLVASSCQDEPARISRSPAPAPLPSPTRTPGGREPSRSSLQPPPGHLYYGASVPYHRSLSDWERELGRPLALNRSYFEPDSNESSQLVQRCRDDVARGRLPHVSIKAPATWQEVAAGAQDEWLDEMLGPLGGTAASILFTVHHEPENDAGPAGMQPSDFVAMQRRVIRLAAETAPQVVVVPVLQHWTFDPVRDDADPGAWLVPEASVMGLDLYNPWSPTNGRPWRSFSSKADEVLPWLGDTPLAIAEYGCRDDPENPGLAAEWLRDAADYAREHNIVSMSYFNSRLNTEDESFELTGETEQAFAELLASDWVTRPA